MVNEEKKVDSNNWLGFLNDSNDERELKLLDIPIAGLCNAISMVEMYGSNLLIGSLLAIASQAASESMSPLSIPFSDETIRNFVILVTISLLFLGTMIAETFGIFGAKELGKCSRLCEKVTKSKSKPTAGELSEIVASRNAPSFYLYQGLIISVVLGILMTVIMMFYGRTVLRLFGIEETSSGMQTLSWMSAPGNIMALMALMFKNHLIVHEEYIKVWVVSIINMAGAFFFGWLFINKFGMMGDGYLIAMTLYGVLSLVTSILWCHFEFSFIVSGSTDFVQTRNGTTYVDFIKERLAKGDSLNNLMHMYGLNMIPLTCARDDIIQHTFECIKSYFTNVHIFLLLIFYTHVIEIVSSDEEDSFIDTYEIYAIAILLISYCFYIYPRNLMCFGLGDLTTLETSTQFNKNDRKDQLNKMKGLFYSYFGTWLMWSVIICLCASLAFGVSFGSFSPTTRFALGFVYFNLIFVNTFLNGILRILELSYFLVVFNSLSELVIGVVLFIYIGLKMSGITLGYTIIFMIVLSTIRTIVYLAMIVLVADWSGTDSFMGVCCRGRVKGINAKDE